MTIRPLVIIAITLMLAGAYPALGQTSFGHYIGKFVAEFGDDGRKVTLKEPYSFVDPAGQEWNVPAATRRTRVGTDSVMGLYPPSPATTDRPPSSTTIIATARKQLAGHP